VRWAAARAALGAPSNRRVVSSGPSRDGGGRRRRRRRPPPRKGGRGRPRSRRSWRSKPLEGAARGRRDAVRLGGRPPVARASESGGALGRLASFEARVPKCRSQWVAVGAALRTSGGVGERRGPPRPRRRSVRRVPAPSRLARTASLRRLPPPRTRHAARASLLSPHNRTKARQALEGVGRCERRGRGCKVPDGAISYRLGTRSGASRKRRVGCPRGGGQRRLKAAGELWIHLRVRSGLRDASYCLQHAKSHIKPTSSPRDPPSKLPSNPLDPNLLSPLLQAVSNPLTQSKQRESNPWRS
jgi:hypothetical protein